MEQELYKAIWWWFVGLGLGLSIRFGYMAIRAGVTDYTLIDDYFKKNLVVLIYVALCYTAIVVLWKSTDFVSFIPYSEVFGLQARVVNAWSILVCFMSDVIIAYVVKKAQDKFKTDPPA